MVMVAKSHDLCGEYDLGPELRMTAWNAGYRVLVAVWFASERAPLIDKARDLPRHVAGRCKLARQRPCGGLDLIAGRVLAGFGHDTRSAAATRPPGIGFGTPVVSGKLIGRS